MRFHFNFLFQLFHPRKIRSFLLFLPLIPNLAQTAEQMDMRGKRYCEIILSRKITHYAIYNTMGLNDCPPNQWNKVTVAQVKQETGFSFAYLNGPRYWVIDGFDQAKQDNPVIKIINGLSVQKAGVLDIKWTNLLRARLPYYQHQVKRQTTWLYEAGKPVYELINTNGEVFVMQSYSMQKIPQTASSLTQLGTKLKLPTGWVFKTGILKKDQTIQVSNNVAIVVRDNLENIYQKTTQDLLQNEEEQAETT